MNPGDKILAPNFKRRLPYRLYDGAKYPGLYFDPNAPVRKKDRKPGKAIFFERPFIRRRQTFRALTSATATEAFDELHENRSNQRKARKGLAHDPYAEPIKRVTTVTELLDDFAKAGFPKTRNRSVPRSERELKDLQRNVRELKNYFGHKDPKICTREDLAGYHAFRIGRIAARQQMASKKKPKATHAKSRPGHRAVDKERVTLSLAYDLAVAHSSKTGITTNPFGRKMVRFCDPGSVEHCRDFQPENADELHLIISKLFESWRSQVLGWQAAFESMIGQRSHEILRLRVDAKTQLQPGFVLKNCLFLYRSKTNKGTYPYAEIHPALRQCLDAHKAWHDELYPNSPWYFPCPLNPRKPVTPGALTKALERVTKELGLPKRTSHGLRSYSMNVLRSQRRADGSHRYADSEIALRHGQRSDKNLKEVYGEISHYPLTYAPENSQPAWARWLRDPAIPAEQLTLGLT